MQPSFPTVSRSGFHRTLRYKVLGLAAGVTVAVAVVAFMLAPTVVLGPWSTYGLPDELRSAALIARDGERGTVYTPAAFWFSKEDANGLPATFVRAGADTLSVSLEDSTYVLRTNGMERFRADGAITAPSQAPYTKVIAYAMRFHGHGDEGSIPTHVPVANPGEWEVHLYLPQTGATERVVSGFSPLFVSDTQFLFFTNSGIYRYDLNAGTAEQVLARPFPLLVSPVLQSPNRNLIAVRDAATNTTTVYQVNGTELVPARVITGMLPAPALSNEALYDVRGTGSGTEVWRYDLKGGEPVLVHTFPATLPIIRLVY